MVIQESDTINEAEVTQVMASAEENARQANKVQADIVTTLVNWVDLVPVVVTTPTGAGACGGHMKPIGELKP
jgi:hypothetical protein